MTHTLKTGVLILGISAMALSCKDDKGGNGMRTFSDDVKDTATTEQARQKVREMGDSLSNAADSVHDAVNDKAEEVGENVSEQAQNVKDAADDTAEDIKDAVDELDESAD